MSCELFQEQIVAQVCGELSDADESELRAHLEGCAACRQTQSEMRSIVGLIQQMPQKEWDEKLRIQDMLRRDRRWQAIVFSKAALWVITLTALITVISLLPIRWQLSDGQFSVRWGDVTGPEARLAEEMRKMQEQLQVIQRQNQEMQKVSDTRMQQLLDQNNLEQQRRYFQTLEMFTNYLELQHQASVQKIQRDIATTYNRAGQDLERTNELLQYVIRTSGTEDVSYDSR